MSSSRSTSPPTHENMALTDLWRAIPGDLAEKSLDFLVRDTFETDPAYTWTRIRHVSAHQKRVIEHRFADFWLPTMSITLYGRASHRIEYRLDTASDEKGNSTNNNDGDMATFIVRPNESRLPPKNDNESNPGWMDSWLRGVWASYIPATHRNITVRLGEGVLGGGCRGAYLLNDTGLPGLEVLDGGRIRFAWKQAVDELLREEMYMRKVGEEMFAVACNNWCAASAGLADEQGMPPPTIQVRLWRSVQLARRVAVFRHRVAKSLEAGGGSSPIELRFAATSAKLHKQTPDPDDVDAVARWSCCGACSRRQPPDIFEVVHVEESVVPQLEIFRRWLAQQKQQQKQQKGHDDNEVKKDGRSDAVAMKSIVDLYRNEYAWRCWIESLGEDGHENPLCQAEWFQLATSAFNHTYIDDLSAILLRDEKVRWASEPW